MAYDHFSEADHQAHTTYERNLLAAEKAAWRVIQAERVTAYQNSHIHLRTERQKSISSNVYIIACIDCGKELPADTPVNNGIITQ